MKFINGLLILTVIALLAIGCYCLVIATEPREFAVAKDARTPSLIAGLFSLSFAVGLVVFGLVMRPKQP